MFVTRSRFVEPVATSLILASIITMIGPSGADVTPDLDLKSLLGSSISAGESPAIDSNLLSVISGKESACDKAFDDIVKDMYPSGLL